MCDRGRDSSALVPKCPKDTSALVPNCPTLRHQSDGAEMSWVRSVLTPSYLRISYSFSHGSELQFMVRLDSGLGLWLCLERVSELWTDIVNTEHPCKYYR